MPDRPATRLYIAEGLAEGAALPLAEAQAHRLRYVLRLAPGAAVAAFNAQQGEWLCRIAAAGLIAERQLRRARPERVNPERLRAIAISAAEQSERLSVPLVAAAEKLDRVLAAWPAERRLVVCDETGGGAPIAAALADHPPGAPAALLVGPEGGFADGELDALGKLPIVTRVGLGPRVLRAETAAVAALAVFQAIAGDWRGVRV